MTAFQTHFATLLRLRGQTVTYSNGSTTKTLKAIKSRPRANQVDATESIIIGSKTWQWLIDPATLALEPKLGHTITDVAGVEYKVQPSNANDLAYVPADGQNTFIRVFTEEQ